MGKFQWKIKTTLLEFIKPHYRNAALNTRYFCVSKCEFEFADVST